MAVERKSLKNLVPPAGIEPTTRSLGRRRKRKSQVIEFVGIGLSTPIYSYIKLSTQFLFASQGPNTPDLW